MAPRWLLTASPAARALLLGTELLDGRGNGAKEAADKPLDAALQEHSIAAAHAALYARAVYAAARQNDCVTPLLSLPSEAWTPAVVAVTAGGVAGTVMAMEVLKDGAVGFRALLETQQWCAVVVDLVC